MAFCETSRLGGSSLLDGLLRFWRLPHQRLQFLPRQLLLLGPAIRRLQHKLLHRNERVFRVETRYAVHGGQLHHALLIDLALDPVRNWETNAGSAPDGVTAQVQQVHSLEKEETECRPGHGTPCPYAAGAQVPC